MKNIKEIKNMLKKVKKAKEELLYKSISEEIDYNFIERYNTQIDILNYILDNN